MAWNHEQEMEALRRAWRDAEPPAALDRAVRLRASRLLAGRRAESAAREEGNYPAWLLGLMAVALVAVLLLFGPPGGRLLWGTASRIVQSWPLAPAWLCLVASNLLAAALAPAVAIWRRSHAN